MSYSRYFRTATPIAVGIIETLSAKNAGPTRGERTRSTTGPRVGMRATSRAAAKVNHLSCWRSSPRARRKW
jgi:hypothetical protein